MGRISCHKAYSCMWCFLQVTDFSRTLLHYLLLVGCRGISIQMVGEEVLSFSDLSVCSNVSLKFSHSSLPAAAYCFLLFLKYVFTEAPPASLMVSALGSSGDWLERILSSMETVPISSQRPPLHRPLVT